MIFLTLNKRVYCFSQVIVNLLASAPKLFLKNFVFSEKHVCLQQINKA